MLLENTGEIPVLSWIWSLNPIIAALVVILVDFGVISGLMILEGRPPWKRGLYMTFKWNDTIFIPIYVGLSAFILQRAQFIDAFYNSTYWHYSVLVVGVLVSLILEVLAVKNGQYNMSQEISPSKLWHTVIFAVVFYWVFASIIPVLLNYSDRSLLIGVIFCIIGGVMMIRLDSTNPPPNDAHLEGSYSPWGWHVRE